MKRILLTKILFLLCALIAGSSSVWAENTEVVFTFNTVAGIEELGFTAPSSGSGTKVSQLAKGGVTIDCTDGSTPTRFYQGSGGSAGNYDFRVYKSGGSLTFTAGSNHIKSISMTGSNLGNLSGEGYSAGSWTGSAASVTLTATNTANITTITVTFGEAAAVQAPSSNIATGVYTGTQSVELSCTTEGAKIYYTTDGSTPSSGSTLYESPIAVSATTTIKAVAIKNAVSSTVTEVAITIPTTTYTNLADLISNPPTVPVILNLTNAQVLAKGSNDMYVKDATGALDFYKLGLPYTAGQLLNGKIAVTEYKVYNNVPEITEVSDNQLSVSDGVLTPIEISLSEATYTNYNCQLVKVTGDVTEASKMGDLILYNKFSGMTETVINNLIPNVNNITVTGIIIPFGGATEICPTAIDYNITLTRDLMTYCGSNKLNYTGSGLTVYTAKVTDGAAVLKELADNANSLKVANNGTGIILSGIAGNTYTVPVTTENVSSSSGNEMKGIVAETAIPWQSDTKYNYILQNGAFYKATGATLRAGKAYLSTTFDVTSAGAPSLQIVYDGLTGINEVKAKNSDNDYYNLSGQRVAQPTKGLYIVNGKKVIIK